VLSDGFLKFKIMTTYVLTVSEFFPKTHKKSGKETGFPLSIKHYDKIHTIRGNQSKQQEIFKYDKTNGIGLQKLEQPNNFVFAPIEGKKVNWDLVAKNDGLSFEDFCDWFKVRSDKPMAIIHFTDFRY